MAVINRWHGQIFPVYENRSTALLLAFLLDPATQELTDQWRRISARCRTTEEKVSAISEWTTTHLAYTQTHPDFSDRPGKDPWGHLDAQTTAFKKLIPPEMKAMALYTKKWSGKCFTLVNLISSGFIQLGVDPDDMVMVIAKTEAGRHAMALIRFEGKILLVNLMMIDFLENHVDPDIKTYRLMGIYNHKCARPVDLDITATDLKAILAASAEAPLLQVFIDHFNLTDRFTSYSF